MSEWITDRLPTQEELGNGAWIRVPHDDSTGWKSRHCDHLKPGEPWAPWPTMPPFKSDEDRARESLPDGYRFVGRGSSEKPLFDKMRFDAIRWDDAKNNWQSTTLGTRGTYELGTRGTYESVFYAVPEEPQPWSKPSDFPPVCWLFVNESDTVCRQVTGFDTSLGRIILHGRKVAFENIRFARWSDRPFDRFEDGNPCTKGGDA